MTEEQKRAMRRSRARIVRLLMDLDDEFVPGVPAVRAAAGFREVARLATAEAWRLAGMAAESHGKDEVLT